jgi:hypothetical protein
VLSTFTVDGLAYSAAVHRRAGRRRKNLVGYAVVTFDADVR